MSEMVERAKAAVIEAGYNPATAEAIVRITLAALREPTPEMIAALHAQWPGGTGSDATRYRTMLAAAVAGAAEPRPSPSELSPLGVSDGPLPE